MEICIWKFILISKVRKSIAIILLNVILFTQISHFLIAGVHERPHIYTLMQTHINPEMTAIRPIPLLLPHHHKSVPGEKRVGNQP